MKPIRRILYLEDSKADCAILKHALRYRDVETVCVETVEEYQCIDQSDYDAVVFDLHVPPHTPMEVIQLVRECELPKAVVSGSEDLKLWESVRHANALYVPKSQMQHVVETLISYLELMANQCMDTATFA